MATFVRKDSSESWHLSEWIHKRNHGKIYHHTKCYGCILVRPGGVAETKEAETVSPMCPQCQGENSTTYTTGDAA